MTALPIQARDSYVAPDWGSTLPQPLTRLRAVDKRGAVMLGTLPGAKRPSGQRPRHDGVGGWAKGVSHDLLAQALLPASSPMAVSLSAGYGCMKSMPLAAGAVSQSV